MKYYSIKSLSDKVTLNLANVPEYVMLTTKRLFQETDGIPLEITHTHNISDRPLYRKPTDDEITSGQYRPGDYVHTTAEDGIL